MRGNRFRNLIDKKAKHEIVSRSPDYVEQFSVVYWTDRRLKSLTAQQRQIQSHKV